MGWKEMPPDLCFTLCFCCPCGRQIVLTEQNINEQQYRCQCGAIYRLGSPLDIVVRN